MTDKTTFTNQTEIENEQEQLAEETRMTEEDTGYDNPDVPREIPDMEFWTEQAFENEKHGFISAIDDHVEEL